MDFKSLKFVLVLIYTFFSVVLCEDRPKTALIVIDVQKCFTNGGTLPVAEGNLVIPVINKIRQDYESYFDLVVFSQDWHCVDHVSFASQHPGYAAYDAIPLKYNEQGELCTSTAVTSSTAVSCAVNETVREVSQVLWPDHCVIDTDDAALHPQLSRDPDDVIVRKGYHCDIDSFSTFYDNAGFGSTELESVLNTAGIRRVVIVGLATDFCVFYSATDAKRLGYETHVVLDATRGISPVSTTNAVNNMTAQGINIIDSTDLDSLFDVTSGAGFPAIGGLPVILAHVLVNALLIS